jgi:hypothetical protein
VLVVVVVVVVVVSGRFRLFRGWSQIEISDAFGSPIGNDPHMQICVLA